MVNIRPDGHCAVLRGWTEHTPCGPAVIAVRRATAPPTAEIGAGEAGQFPGQGGFPAFVKVDLIGQYSSFGLPALIVCQRNVHGSPVEGTLRKRDAKGYAVFPGWIRNDIYMVIGHGRRHVLRPSIRVEFNRDTSG